MKLIIILGTLAFALATPLEEIKPSFWPVPSERFTDRIINGEAAEKGAAPFICSLRWLNRNTGVKQHMCGCSIIADNWVMTAAHCLTEVPAGEMDILCGLTERIPNGNEQIRQFDRLNESVAIWHAAWRPGGQVGPNDIAVIRVEEPFSFTEFVQPIRLLNASVDYGVAQLFGWGADSTGSLPLQLQTAEKDVLTFDTCVDLFDNISLGFGSFVDITNVCTVRNTVAACGGDSGGPLVRAVNNQWAQIGVVSWGVNPCGLPMAPSVFTDVYYFIDWIAERTLLRPVDFTVEYV